MTPRHLLRAALICFALALACLTVLCSVNCAPSLLGKSLNVAVVGSAVADVHSTHQGLAAGGVEGNPLMGNPWVRVAAKAAAVATVIAGSREMEMQGHTVLAHLLRATASAVWLTAAASNYRLAREMR